MFIIKLRTKKLFGGNRNYIKYGQGYQNSAKIPLECTFLSYRLFQSDHSGAVLPVITLSQMQIRKIAPAVIFIFMTMFTLKMFAFNRLDVKRELTLRFTHQNLSDLFEAKGFTDNDHGFIDKVGRSCVRISLYRPFRTMIYIIR